jgi:hypothetical protein
MKVCQNEVEAKKFVAAGEKKLGLAKESSDLAAMQSAVKGAGFVYKKDFDGKGKDKSGAPCQVKFEEWEKR